MDHQDNADHKDRAQALASIYKAARAAAALVEMAVGADTAAEAQLYSNAAASSADAVCRLVQALNDIID